MFQLGICQRFAERIRQLYPGIPPGRGKSIAEHACRKYSGRIGRTAAAKDLEEEAIHLSVRAHIRHVGTEYDELLLRGFDRSSARAHVEERIQDVLTQWKQDEPGSRKRKIHFATSEVHIQIVELLRELKQRFIADLEVMDEGGYWETKDSSVLEKNMTGLKKNIDFLYDALQSEHCKGLRDLPPEELAEEIERMLSKSPEDLEDQY